MKSNWPAMGEALELSRRNFDTAGGAEKVSVFSPETEKSLWLPESSNRNPGLALRQSLKHYGVTVFEHEEVLSVLTEHGRAAGVQTASHQLMQNNF